VVGTLVPELRPRDGAQLVVDSGDEVLECFAARRVHHTWSAVHTSRESNTPFGK
jgi:hypothetical protein